MDTKRPSSKPSSVKGTVTGSFASQGGYGHDPMGRPDHSQPNTFATNQADRTAQAQRANEEGQADRTKAQESIAHEGVVRED
jgi:hypothetical protein